jgi:glycosyltransferase involved in cell wall biosynthesis
MKAFDIFNNNCKTAIIQAYFFLDFNLHEERPVGGGNRYLYDLGRSFHKSGYKVIYIQKGVANKEIEFDDWATVISVKAPRRAWGDIVYAYRAYKLAKKTSSILCYGNLEDCFPFVHKRGFAIQHGVWWDRPMPWLWKKMQYARIKYVLKRIRGAICVDSNFINIIRASWPDMSKQIEKLRFVINYADTHEYFPAVYKNDRKILLFPRRFEKNRGYEIFIQACSILKNHGLVFDIYFIGEGGGLSHIERLLNTASLRDRSKIIKCAPEAMPDYYRMAFLTYVPSLWSEGTSLSAVEAICSGCPVIATDVGGLPNIIINGFNGFIVKADAEEIAKVTERMMVNEEEQKQLAANCISLRNALSKERWEIQISEIIKSFLSGKEEID